MSFDPSHYGQTDDLFEYYEMYYDRCTREFLCLSKLNKKTRNFLPCEKSHNYRGQGFRTSPRPFPTIVAPFSENCSEIY